MHKHNTSLVHRKLINKTNSGKERRFDLKTISRIWALTFFMALLLTATSQKSALAYNTFHNHKLIYGVGNYGNDTQYYWIDSSASEFAGNIKNAMENWKKTTDYWGITTPIWYMKTSRHSRSRMDIIHDSDVQYQWWGRAVQIYQGSQIDPDTMNWAKGKVLLAHDYASYPNLKKQTIAHEMGHVMGLAHTSMQAIMQDPIVNTNITRAQPNDLAGINHLY